MLLEEVDDLGVDAETRGGVGGLAEKTRGETLRGETRDERSADRRGSARRT